MSVRDHCFKKIRARSLAALPIVASILLLASPASPQGQALEHCRETVGKPIVMPCMKAGGTLESCRARATPKVRACVQAAMGGKGGGPSAVGNQGAGAGQPRSAAGPAARA